MNENDFTNDELLQSVHAIPTREELATSFEDIYQWAVQSGLDRLIVFEPEELEPMS